MKINLATKMRVLPIAPKNLAVAKFNEIQRVDTTYSINEFQKVAAEVAQEVVRSIGTYNVRCVGTHVVN
jgi:hypothetical protein